MLEKHVNSVISAFLESNNMLHSSQTGFHPQHGTETALLTVVEKDKKNLDKGGSTAILLLDLSAAFDTVNYDILIHRLRNFGLSSSVITWLQYFLKDRSFQVFKGDNSSELIPLGCSVPQGLSLSLTLFNVYMSPLAPIVLPFVIDIVTYADDTQLVVALNHSGSISTSLCPCLEKVAKWMELSFLKLNGDKTDLMLLGNSPISDIDPAWPSCLGSPPTPKNQIKSLGMWLDQSLTFDYQATILAASCYGNLRMLRKVLPLLPFSARRLMVQALILSCLNYGNALYLGAPRTTTNKLQVIQNCAARMLFMTPNSHSARPALKTLHWLPVVDRIKFKSLCIAHKSFWKKGPPILQAIISLTTQTHAFEHPVST